MERKIAVDVEMEERKNRLYDGALQLLSRDLPDPPPKRQMEREGQAIFVTSIYELLMLLNWLTGLF